MITATLHNCNLPDREHREWRIANYLTRRFNQSADNLLDCYNYDRDRFTRIYNRALSAGKRWSYRKANRHWYFTVEIK